MYAKCVKAASRAGIKVPPSAVSPLMCIFRFNCNTEEGTFVHYEAIRRGSVPPQEASSLQESINHVTLNEKKKKHISWNLRCRNFEWNWRYVRSKKYIDIKILITNIYAFRFVLKYGNQNFDSLNQISGYLVSRCTQMKKNTSDEIRLLFFLYTERKWDLVPLPAVPTCGSLNSLQATLCTKLMFMAISSQTDTHI